MLSAMNEKEESLFPMRINKYLAYKNYSTRRGGDEIIKKGQVFINQERAKAGDWVNENDVVDVRIRGKQKDLVYFAYNKPRGIVTHSPGKGEKDIQQSISLKDVFPLGRLDKDSSGLIILTNDGRITDKLLNPENIHDKEYVVTTKNKLRTSFKAKMEAGVKIDKEMTKKCKVTILNDHTFKITLTEGKKHQIRRMCVALFQDVDTLKRTRIMNINLGKLPEGSFRKIEGEELSIFFKSLGM